MSNLDSEECAGDRVRSICALSGRDNRATRETGPDPPTDGLPEIHFRRSGFDGIIRPNDSQLIREPPRGILQKKLHSPGGRLKGNNPGSDSSIPRPKL